MAQINAKRSPIADPEIEYFLANKPLNLRDKFCQVRNGNLLVILYQLAIDLIPVIAGVRADIVRATWPGRAQCFPT